MWMLIARRPRPDAPLWAGRRFLAVLDALAWPAAWIAAAQHLPARGGLVGSVVIAVAIFLAAVRARRALCANERYFFTTWRWGRILLSMMLFGLLIQRGLAT